MKTSVSELSNIWILAQIKAPCRLSFSVQQHLCDTDAIQTRNRPLNFAVRWRICPVNDEKDDSTMATTNPLQFIQQVRSEVSKVIWPTRREVLLTTVMVFIMAALAAVIFALVDLAIRGGLQALLAAIG